MHKGNNTAKGTTNRLLQRWNKSLSLWILGCNNLKVELPKFRVWEEVQESIVRRSMLRKIEILLRKENRKRPREQERARAEWGKGPVTKTRRSSMYACHVNLKLNGSLLISGTRKRREQGPKFLVGWQLRLNWGERCGKMPEPWQNWKPVEGDHGEDTFSYQKKKKRSIARCEEAPIKMNIWLSFCPLWFLENAWGTQRFLPRVFSSTSLS